MGQSPRTKSSIRPRSELRLSEVARHVHQPSGIVSSGWRPVRERCAKFGVGFDGWQQGLGTLALGKRSDGLYAASIGGVVASIPRQTGKTYLFGWMVFALCTLQSNLTVIWTAHRTRTSNETFEKMRTMAKKPSVAPYVESVRAANGEQQVRFKNGSRILFGAREQGFGRGFDEVDVLVLDEAQILTESAMSDMVPATNAAPNGLVIMMGTPPRPRDPGEVFQGRRDDALAGDEDTLYVEFSADEGAKIIDWKQLEVANPSFPHRTSRTAILRMQKLLGSNENFTREAYGIWDKKIAGSKAFKRSAWDVLAGVKPDDDGLVSYGVKFTADGSGVGLGAAHKFPDGRLFVEPIRQANLGEGIEWLVDYLSDRHAEAAQIVVDGKAGVGYLVNALRDAGVRNKKLVVVPTLDQVLAAHAMFEQEFVRGGFTHPGVAAFDDQVLAAVKRPIGKSGGFGWAHEADEGTVVSLDAVTLALWGVKTTRRRPGLRQEVSI